MRICDDRGYGHEHTEPSPRAHRRRGFVVSTPTYVRRAARPADNYSIIPNSLIRDRRLSDHARMLAIWLLSHREDYHFDTAAMATAMGVGRDRTRTSIRELEAVGYLRREHIRHQGRLVAIQYTLTDEPQVSTNDGFSGAGADQGEPPEPETQGRKPRAGNPGPENPSPIKKTKYEEDQREEDQQDHPSPGGDDAADGALFVVEAPTGTRAERAAKMAENAAALAEEFEAKFWPLYPRKVGKLAAQHAFARARRKGASLDDLIAGVTRYAKTCAGKDARFIAHAATWLNAGRWMDEEDPAVPAGAAPKSHPWVYRDEDHWSTG